MEQPIDSKEKESQQLRKLSQELKIPVFEAWLEMEVKMPDGKVVHHHRQRSHSWNRNAYNVMAASLMSINRSDAIYGAGYINNKDIAGAVYSGAIFLIQNNPQNVETAGVGYVGAAGTATGIVVGSGAGAENFEDFALGTLIANGVGAGQLSYVAGDVPVKSYVAGTKTYSTVYVRYFNNNSGGNVSVNEVGIYNYHQNAGKTWMDVRDKLASTVTIPNTGQLKVTYTIQLTYPA